MWRQDRDELRLEELVPVEEYIVAEPSTSCGDEPSTEEFGSHLQRLDIVARDAGLLLGYIQLLARQWHLVPTIVDEPQSANCRDSKGDSEGPLCRDLGIRRIAAAVVEHKEKDNKECLVEELTPSLHQEGHGDLPSAMETILFGRNTARSRGILHGRSGGHGIFSTNSDTIEEKGPGVADDPAIYIRAPGCNQHDKSEKHDDGVLNETPTSSHTIECVRRRMSNGDTSLPITQIPYQNLPYNDTANLKISDRLNPGLVACLVLRPALGPDSIEERSQVTDGEEYVSMFAVSGYVTSHARRTHPSSPSPAPGKTAFLKYHETGLKGSFLAIVPIAPSSLAASWLFTLFTKPILFMMPMSAQYVPFSS